MIDTRDFYETLTESGFDFFTGVPDSLLKDLCRCITDLSGEKHITAANEGNALAIACGYNIATGRCGVVYMQNSGLGNIVNPLLSLADEKVYKIPMLLIIGYRGEPGVKDEPQHVKQGELTLPLLETLGVKYMILDESYRQQVKECEEYIKETGLPIALVVKKGSFSAYEAAKHEVNDNILTREEALETIIDRLSSEDFVVSTTGKTSREIFEIRERKGQDHGNDFLTVGSMGHTSSLALGISLNTDKNIFCIDGDGSFIMHMGGLAVAVQKARENFKYILINNGCHESVGGQPTIGYDIDIEKILYGFGYEKVWSVQTREGLELAMEYLESHRRSAIIVTTNDSSRVDLGRPTTTPVSNKEQFQNRIR